MKPILKPLLAMMGVVLCPFSFNTLYAQSKVVIPGTFQSELGCSGDWLPDCDNTALTFNSSTGLWTGTFNIPKGCYQYKVALDGNWNVNYGEGGIYGANLSLYVPEDGLVTFTFNLEVGYVQTTPYVSGFSELCLPQVVLAGDFQNELGCTNDWDASCTNTALRYVPETGQFENDITLPAGFYQYRAILNNDWAGTNYGSNGMPSGSDYFYYTPCQQKVHFTYNPVTHLVTYLEIPPAVPDAVVVAGSFQSELGCPGDWLPDCDKTGMEYNELYGIWTDTMYIPAGHWEYKITINNSWDENYGLNNEAGGPNIPLDLCYPSRVVFNFSKAGCFATIFSFVITNGICVNSFYDANINGLRDAGEEAMSGVNFILTGEGITQTQISGNDGTATFTNLPDGFYTLEEKVPDGYFSPFSSSLRDFYLFGFGVTSNFAHVCLGPGTAKDKGFWISKNGEAALTNGGLLGKVLTELGYLNLRNADGSDFDPKSYAEIRTFLKTANAKNIANMLSAELATLYLSLSVGLISYETTVYAATCDGLDTPHFTRIAEIIGESNFYLSIVPSSTGNDPYRDYLNCTKERLAGVNNNLNYVQPHPCTASTKSSAVNNVDEIHEENVTGEVKVSPNPSKTYFTLRPSNKEKSKSVELKVFNIYGQQVYRANGSSTKDYRFGENFTPGVYVVQVTQGNKKTTLKLMKQ